MSGFQHLTDKMLRFSRSSPNIRGDGKRRDTSTADHDASAPIHYSSRTRYHATGGPQHHRNNHYSRITGTGTPPPHHSSAATHSSSAHSSTQTTSSDNKKSAFTASSRIPSSDPSRQSILLELDAERQKVKQLEATVDRQKRTIAALSDRVDKQGRDNANSALANRSLYAELEAQAKWVEGLDTEARTQVRKGRALLAKFAYLRSGGAPDHARAAGEGGK